jgi:hypothetical protein
LAAIVIGGAVAFAAGFILLWSLGSWLVGGGGFPGGSDGSPSASLGLAAQSDYTVEPLVDMVAFRDLSYVPVKGIYVTSFWAGRSDLLDGLIGIADRTEINALVIDVKDDLGKVTYDTDVPLVKELGLSDKTRIADIDGLMAKLAEHNIIPIARVVCFKDTGLAKARPQLAVRSSKGGKWADYKGLNYTNPYSHEVWEYLVEIAEDAARHGFREIQFDYVRFPTDGPISEAVYPGEYCTKGDAIAGFLAYARERLEKLGVWVSADVFGLTVNPQQLADSERIGQIVEKMAANVDIVCPMVYPQGYYSGSYGIEDPNAHPYETVTAATKDTVKRLVGTGAMGRPWLQDYDWGGVEYGVQRVKEQIKAAEEQGFTEWILWDASQHYTEGALRKEGS